MVQHLLLILVAAACLVYVALAAILFSLWLRESEARDLRMERFAQRDPITLEAERRRMLAGDRAD